jgi:hypothetical protein
LLESIQGVVDRLKLHTPISPTPAIDNVLIKQMVELISILTWVTRKLKGRRPRESFLNDMFIYFTQPNAVILVKDFFAVKDIKQARQRLDRLIQEEIAVTTAQIREDVHGLKRRLMDGEPTHSAPNTSSIKYSSL